MKTNILSQRAMNRARTENGIDALLGKFFGLKSDELMEMVREIRRISDMRGKITEAGLLIYEASGNNPQSVSLGSIAAVVGGVHISTRRAISNFLKEEFQYEKDRLERETGLKLTYPHMLRRDIGIYEGNLEEAKKKWRDIKVSSHDLIRSVRIPLEADYMFSQFLGIIFGAGSLTTANEGLPRIEIVGGSGDEEFLRDVVKPSFEWFFGIHPTVYCKNSTGRYSSSYDFYSISTDSVATNSWLINVAGLRKRKSRGAPKIPVDERGFLEGAIAAGGYFSGSGPYFSLVIRSKSEKYLKSLKDYAGRSGIETQNIVRENIQGEELARYALRIYEKRSLAGMQLLHPTHRKRYAELTQVVGE